MRICISSCVWLLLALLAACGGSGGADHRALALMDPPVLHSLMPKHIRVLGANLGEPGETVTLRFTAPEGTPFAGGTSATADITGTVASPSAITAVTPYDLSRTEVRATLTCLWPNGETRTLPYMPQLRPVTKQPCPDRSSFSPKYFGVSVAIRGATALVGQPEFEWGGVYGGTAWIIEMKGGEILDCPENLVHWPRDETANYGQAVALTDRVALVSVLGSQSLGTSGPTRPGMVDAFERADDYWRHHDGARASNGLYGDDFGWSLAVSGHFVIVGAPLCGYDLTSKIGAAYIYSTLTSEGGDQQEYELRPFSATDPDIVDQASDARFGLAVAIDEDTAVVGAPGHRYSASTGPGTAYVFVYRNGAWHPQQRLEAMSGEPRNQFGASVAVKGDTILVGAPSAFERVPGLGAVYVFTRSAGVWTERQRLVPSTGEGAVRFGHAISVWNDRAVVGSPGDPYGGVIGAGSAYVFGRSQGAWHEMIRLLPSDPPVVDNFAYDHSFGSAVGICGT